MRANWAESALAAGRRRHRRGADQSDTLSGPLLAGAAAVPDAGHGRGAGQQLGRPAGPTAARLRERRQTEYRRDRRAFAAGAATGGAVAVFGVTLAAVALLLGHSPRVAPGPALIGPAQGRSSSPAASGSPSPGASGTSGSPSPGPSGTSTSPSRPTTPPTSSTAPASPSPSASATSASPSPSARPTSSSGPPSAPSSSSPAPGTGSQPSRSPSMTGRRW